MRKRNTVKQRFTYSILWKDNRFQNWTEDRRLERMFQSYLASDSDLEELETLSVAEEAGYAELHLVNLCLEDWKNRKHKTSKNLSSSSEETTSRFATTDDIKQNDIQEEKEQKQNKKFVRKNIVKLFVSHNLEAYLQEAIYRVANKLNNKYQEHSQFKSYSIQDYFNLGILLLYQRNIIEKYDFAINSNLEAYTYTKLKQRITDELRRQDKFTGKTDEYLLLEVGCNTEQRMRKALLWQGIAGKSLEEYIFVWYIYREIRQQTKKVARGRTQPPTELDWNAIYQEIKTINPDFEHSIKTIKGWIDECRKALRKYLSPSAISLENPISQSVDNLSYKDVLKDAKAADKIRTLEEISESRGIANNLKSWIFEEFERLKADAEELRIEPEFKKILDMQYGLQMTQTEIANHINSAYPEIASRISRNGVVGQFQISRKITKVKKILLEKTIEYMKETKFLSQSGIEISFERFQNVYLENFIKNFDIIFSSILTSYYNSLDWEIYKWLRSKILSFSDEQKLFINLFYAKKVPIYDAETRNIISEDGNQNEANKKYRDICFHMNKEESNVLELQSKVINSFVNDYTEFSNKQLNIIWSDKEADLTLRLINSWLTTYHDEYLN